MVLHGFKSQGSKTRSVDSKFAAPYIGSWPFVISRLRNNQVAFGAKQTSSSRQHRLDKSKMTHLRHGGFLVFGSCEVQSLMLREPAGPSHLERGPCPFGAARQRKTLV